METGPRLKVSSDRLVKQRIEPATPGLQGKQFIHCTTAAPQKEEVPYLLYQYTIIQRVILLPRPQSNAPLFIQCITPKSVFVEVSKGVTIRNRYNQVPHLTQDTNGKVINLQLDTTNESQEVSPFPAGDHKAHINRRVQGHSKHKTERKT